jgi:hypothetical protein
VEEKKQQCRNKFGKAGFNRVKSPSSPSF